MKGKRGKGKARQRDKVGGDIILASQRRPQTDRAENREGDELYKCLREGLEVGTCFAGVSREARWSSVVDLGRMVPQPIEGAAT